MLTAKISFLEIAGHLRRTSTCRQQSRNPTRVATNPLFPGTFRRAVKRPPSFRGAPWGGLPVVEVLLNRKGGQRGGASLNHEKRGALHSNTTSLGGLGGPGFGGPGNSYAGHTFLGLPHLVMQIGNSELGPTGNVDVGSIQRTEAPC